MNVLNSRKTYEHHDRQHQTKKKYTRSLQTSWYKKYPWITVCESTYKIYCHVCRQAKHCRLITFSKRQLQSFIDNGFCNWKNALTKLAEHERSDMHKEAVLKLAAKSSAIDVSAQLNKEHAAIQEHHQAMLLKLLSSVRFLARQGLSLRGHNENSESLEGNLYNLLLLRAEDIPNMKAWIMKKDYTSPEIINEMIGLMGNTVLRQILAQIKSSSWFSIIVDEATDVCRNEQMSLIVRWTDYNYQIYEEPIGLVQLPDTKAQSICSVIKDLLIRCSLPLAQCRGQAYDGAANMSGIKNGVQALIKKENPHILYVHCLAHSLNLCIQHTAKGCELIRNVMDFLYEIIQLIKCSPKRLTLFNSIRAEVSLGGENTPLLRSICPTRWTVRSGSIDSILKNYNNLIATLEDVQLGSDEYASKGSGLLTQMETFEIFFGLKLAHLLFSSSEQFSSNLQAKNTTIQEAMHGARLLITHYDSLRKESQFNRFYDQVIEESSHFTQEPTLPRYRKRPRRIDDGSTPHRYKTPKERYRHIYFEVLDVIKGEVERRFNQDDCEMVQKLESLLIDAANGKPSTPDESLLVFLEKDINKAKFLSQLTMVSDLIKNAFDSSPIKHVTSIRTIADAMNTSDIYKKMLEQIHIVLKIYFTIPVTTATAERSFSSLRRLKTYLRSTMTQHRLNNLFLLYVHQEKTDKLDLKFIAKEFCSVNQRRVNYFGKVN